jgi:hypothetical protein
LSDLDVFISQFLGNDKAHLIVTGDLTATGHPKEFETANQYLGGVLRSAHGHNVGLEVHDWADRAILGNHDHLGRAPSTLGRTNICFLPVFS